MTLRMKPIKTDPELLERLRQYVEDAKAMTPEQRREMHRAQRKSWVVGEMMLENENLSKQKAEEIYDRVCDY